MLFSFILVSTWILPALHDILQPISFAFPDTKITHLCQRWCFHGALNKWPPKNETKQNADMNISKRASFNRTQLSSQHIWYHAMIWWKYIEKLFTKSMNEGSVSEWSKRDVQNKVDATWASNRQTFSNVST